MLTYDKVPQDIKSTIVGILADGVNLESLRVCAAGLALENQIQLGNVPADSHENEDLEVELKVVEAEQGNTKKYAELALEIYSRAIADAIKL